jgi:nucleotide-binding universal stress UspA family protein
MQQIVVAVDGSEASQQALSHAIHLARQGHSSLTGVFVIDGEWPDYIGNDWQSSKGSRQGFLDYIQAEQQQQAESARLQFEDAARGMPDANFSLKTGDPAGVLIDMAQEDTTDLLVLSRRVYQVSGRPSLRTLGERLAKKATRPFLLFP